MLDWTIWFLCLEATKSLEHCRNVFLYHVKYNNIEYKRLEISNDEEQIRG